MVKPRTSLHDLEICEHGGIRKSIDGELIDFSANLNPHGPPRFILDAIKEAVSEIQLYPDTESTELRAVISEKIGCTEEEILVGAGISELIRLVALSFIKNRALLTEHTYGEYELASKMMGASVKEVEMPDLIIDVESIMKEMKKDDVVFLCNPNNPTGQYLKEGEIRSIAECAEDKNALLVIDEAYVDFVDEAFDSSKLDLSSDNVILLRSLTKSYSIPGLRVGYSVGSEENIKAMMKVKPPWNVSIFAQMAGVAAMEDRVFLNESRKRISESKKIIERSLGVHSDANFYLLDVGNVKKTKKELINQGILVRDCTSFGLPSHIRFSVRRDDENELLINALLGFTSVSEQRQHLKK